MTTKIIIAAGCCSGKEVLVEIGEKDEFGDDFLRESHILRGNDFCEYYIWKDRSITITEQDIT